MPIKEWGKLKVQSSIQQAHLSQSHSGKSKVRNVEEDGWAFLCLKKLRVTRFRFFQALVLIFLVQSFSLPVFSSPLLSINQEQQKEPIESALVQRTIDFNIPQQRADLALTLFAEQANLTLVFPFDDVRGCLDMCRCLDDSIKHCWGGSFGMKFVSKLFDRR